MNLDLLQHPAAHTAILGLLGALAYWGREVPALVLGWLRQYVVSSLTVDSRDAFVFAAVIEHLERFPALAASNQFTAHSRRQGSEDRDLQDDIRMGLAPRTFVSPAQGLHIFRADGRLLWLRRDLQAAQTVFERLTLSHFGRSQAPLKRFLDEAVAARLARDSGALSVYVPSPFEGGEWTRARVGTRRALDSVVLRRGLAEALLADLQGFFSQRERYADWGVPWRRGYLLYGPPGTGKTSLVTALASELGLNICTFSLASPLVTDEKVHALLASVPPRSLLLIEDVDAFFNQREAVHDEVRLSFSGFLNALDGVATQEGSVLFMTTNHPERLDPALIRAGRIDQRVPLERCDDDQLRRLFVKFRPEADAAEADAFVQNQQGRGLTPAQVQSLLMPATPIVAPTADWPEGAAVEPPPRASRQRRRKRRVPAHGETRETTAD